MNEIITREAALIAELAALHAERQGGSRLTAFIAEYMERRPGAVGMDFADFCRYFKCKLTAKESREWPHIQIQKELERSGWQVRSHGDWQCVPEMVPRE